MITFFLFLSSPLVFAQLDLCEPSVNPSPSCLCTRLDFMDTYSYRLRFGNSSFAGNSYRVSAPTFNANYDCVSEQPLQCAPASGDSKSSAFAVFDMKYIVEIPNRIPSVKCFTRNRLFDMESAIVEQYRKDGKLPLEKTALHLTEVGCIEYGGSTIIGEDTTTKKSGGITLPPTVLPEDCNCSKPPQLITQTIFDKQYAFNFPQTKFTFGTPSFTYTVGCQHVSMICSSSQKAIMFFNDQYIINGNDILDVAAKYNLHCDSGVAKWKFDEPSEQKFKDLLGINSIELSHLGCASFNPRS